MQQTSSFILKQVGKLLKGEPVILDSLKILETDEEKLKALKSPSKLTEVQDLITILIQIFNLLLLKGMQRLQTNTGTSETLFEAWNTTQPWLQNLGRVFGIILIANNLTLKLPLLLEKSKTVGELVSKISKLFIIDKIIVYSSEVLACSYLSKAQFDELEISFNSLCRDLGESCVNVIDAIAEDDFIHGSPIGAKDGQAYSRFTKAVENQPDCYQEASWLPDIKKLASN